MAMQGGRVYKMLVALGILCLAGLLCVQVWWFSAAYNLAERQLTERTTLAMRQIANTVGDLHGDHVPAVIEKNSSNSFQLTYPHGITYERIDSLSRNTFAEYDLSLPFQVVGYNNKQEIMFGNFYKQGATSEADALCLHHGLAKAETEMVNISFPQHTTDVIGGMRIWIFSASAFIVVLALTMGMMVHLSRSKHRAEVRADFISNMTHELQTPIANIAMASEVLKKNRDANSRAQHYVNIISSENLRLKAHIDQVLQTAMLEKGELAMSRQEININEIVREITEVFNERIAVRGGRLSVDIGAVRPVVFADVLHLKNILYNLLDNAEKYSPGSPDITVSTADCDEGVVVSVSDKGMGIVKEHQTKIFEKFFRASKGNVHDIKGFGLGLTYVKGIVEAHNGTVRVSSVPGKGSRFDVMLQNCI
ncbi:HAMP domain-containing sensor histidine kinase [Chryseolinea sp. T2]|uniref:sensor histidine kinase n=1 Tax=Chryseolinea sp. T2 TaxID=3129255 RepID=UPI00307791B5